MRKVSLISIFLLSAFAGILVIAVLLLQTPSSAAEPSAAQPTHARPYRPPEALAADPVFNPTNKPSEGIPALQPSKDKSTLDASTPAFTAEEVRVYISRTNAVGLVSGARPDIPVTITNIEFLRERDLRARQNGAGTGYPEDTLLCYVDLRGSFGVVGPPPSAPEQCGRAIIIFHAQTGNILMTGVDCNAE